MGGYDSFSNYYGEGVAKGDPKQEVYQGLPDYPEIDEIINNSDEERTANFYDQYIGDEVVIPDRKGEKLVGKFRKRVKYDDTSSGGGDYNAMHDNYLYEVEYHDGTTDQLAANIIAENILS